MDCIHKVLNLMKEYHFNRTLMVILNCNCISLIINFIVFMGEKMEGGRKCNKSQSKSGKWCTCIKLTIARKWRISIAPFLSTLIGWIFMPAIWALAGFVPWAEVGIRHTYIRQQYSVSEWQSSKHSDSYINQNLKTIHESIKIDILVESGQYTYSSLVLPVGMEIGHDGS